MACGKPCMMVGATMLPVFSRTNPPTKAAKKVQKPHHGVGVQRPMIRLPRFSQCMRPKSTAVITSPQPQGTPRKRKGLPKAVFSRDWI
jgi:hypothetical protein